MSILNDEQYIIRLRKDYNFNKFLNECKDFSKVILIGSSSSLRCGKFGDYIDNSGIPVVRCNYQTIHSSDIQEFSGTKTNLVISFLKNSDLAKKNNIFKVTSDINSYCRNNLIQYPKGKYYYPTTGMVSLHILMNFFDEIEIGGFGNTYSFKNISSTKYYVNNASNSFNRHKIFYEDSLIDLYVKRKYVGKIYRMEDSHPDLLINKRKDLL